MTTRLPSATMLSRLRHWLGLDADEAAVRVREEIERARQQRRRVARLVACIAAADNGDWHPRDLIDPREGDRR